MSDRGPTLPAPSVGPAVGRGRDHRRSESTLRVVLAFLKTATEESLKKVPVLGGFVAAAEKMAEELAAEEAGQTLARVAEQVAGGTATIEEMQADLAFLGELAEAVFLLLPELLAWAQQSGRPVARGELTAFATDTALLVYWHRVALELMYADHRGVAEASREAHLASLPLDDVYVMPRLVPERATVEGREREKDLLAALADPDISPAGRVAAEEEYAALSGGRWDPTAAAEQAETLSLGDALASARTAVLLGGPGVGKSVLTRWLARTCVLEPGVMQARLGWHEALTPVILPLAAYADALATRGAQPSGFPLRAFLGEAMDRRGGEALRRGFEEELVGGRALVLLDGIDEVPDARMRADVVRAVDAFLADLGGSRCLVTSRPFGYIPLAGQIPHFQIPNFSPAQVEEFVRGWLAAFERRQHPDAPDPARAHAEAESLLAELRRNPQVAALATNPLMLVIVCLIRYEQLRLPEKRVQLYNRAVTTLLDTWNIWRSEPRCSVGGVVLPLERLVRVWGAVAAWSRREKPTGLLHRAVLLRKLTEILVERQFDEEEPEATAASYLKAASHHAGLIEERGKDLFAFWHPTFEEFLAAVELATPTSRAVAGIVPLRDDPRWREVVLLAVGYVGIVQRDAETASEIAKAIQAQEPLPVVEPLLHPCLLLAAACVADNVGVVRTVAQEILAELAVVIARQPYEELNDAFVTTVQAVPKLRPGKDLLDALSRLVHHPDADVRREAARLASNAAQDPRARDLCEALLEDGDLHVRSLAALTLARSGVSRPAVWKAIAAARWGKAGFDPEVLDFFATTPRAAADAWGSLSARGSDDRMIGAEMLAALGRADDAVVVALRGLLGVADPLLRYRAATLLVELGHPDQSVVDALTALLRDASLGMRRGAAASLVQLGEVTADVIDTLLAVMAGADQRDAALTRRLLGRLAAESESVVDTLVDRLVDPRLGMGAFDVLARVVGRDDPSPRAAVVALLDHEGASSRSRELKARGALPPGPDVVDALRRVLDSGDPPVRYLAAESLQELGASDEQVVEALAVGLREADAALRIRAARSLIGAGMTAAPGEALRELLDTDDPTFRLDAAELLLQIGHHLDEALRTLVGMLAAPEPAVRLRAARMVAQFSRANEAVVSTMTGRLTHEDPQQRLEAADYLIQREPVRPYSPAVVETLTGLLGSPDHRFAAARRLSRMGRLDPAVVGALLESMRTRSTLDAVVARTLLEDLSRHGAVLDTLLGLLEVDDRDLVLRAAEFLNAKALADVAVAQALIRLLPPDGPEDSDRVLGSVRTGVLAEGEAKAFADLTTWKVGDDAERRRARTVLFSLLWRRFGLGT